MAEGARLRYSRMLTSYGVHAMTDAQTGTTTTGNAGTNGTNTNVTYSNGANAPTDGGKTFTQAEVDSIVLKRAERVAADKYADYADLTAKAKRLDDIEAASASELEKAVKKAREEERTTVTNEVTRERILDKIEVAAAGKFADTEDARLRVGRKAADFIGKDGSIDIAAITAAVDKELENAPHLKANTLTRPKPDPSQGSGDKGTGDKFAEGVAEARRRFGTPAGSK